MKLADIKPELFYCDPQGRIESGEEWLQSVHEIWGPELNEAGDEAVLVEVVWTGEGPPVVPLPKRDCRNYHWTEKE